MHEGHDSFLLLDIGDHIDRSHIFTEGTLGQGNVELLNDAGYDYITIGNNEGITLGQEDLNHLYWKAKFEVIVSNFTDCKGTVPSWLIPYKIHLTKSGVRIGIVAATADFGTYYEKLGWHIQPPIDRLKEVCEDLKGKVDIILCMSHLGKSHDELMAEQIPQIDVIFGAHTHHFFENGKMVNGTLLAAAGKYGAYVGQVAVEYDHASKEVVSKNAVLYPIEKLERPANYFEQINKWNEIGKANLAYSLFNNATFLKKDWFHASNLSDFFGDALLAYTGADCAMFPAGIFLTDLPDGKITAKDLHTLLPHPINPCVVTLTGAELLETLELSKNEDWPFLEVKGLGFRGKYLGVMLFEQLVEYEDGAVYVQGEPIHLEKTYTLATLDMFTFGYFFPSFKLAAKQYFMPELIRDVLKWFGQLQDSSIK